MEISEDILGFKPNNDKGFSKAVKGLAGKVQKTFDAYRELMHKYEKNIEVVDPQLRNNDALVEVLKSFEDTWSLANSQIVDQERLRQLNEFSWLLINTGERYSEFQEQMECRDA